MLAKGFPIISVKSKKMKSLYKRVSPGEKILHVPKACGIAILCNVVSVAMRLHFQILDQLADVLVSFLLYTSRRAGPG